MNCGGEAHRKEKQERLDVVESFDRIG